MVKKYIFLFERVFLILRTLHLFMLDVLHSESESDVFRTLPVNWLFCVPFSTTNLLAFTSRNDMIITSGARSAERVFFYIPEKSQYERPAGRPAVVTLFERIFLWNGMTNSRTVILLRCHHPISHVFDRYRYPPVPATARGTCRGEGVEDTLSLGNSTTAGPIAFKFGV